MHERRAKFVVVRATDPPLPKTRVRSQDGAPEPRGDVAIVVRDHGLVEAALDELVLESFGEVAQLGVASRHQNGRVYALQEDWITSAKEQRSGNMMPFLILCKIS